MLTNPILKVRELKLSRTPICRDSATCSSACCKDIVIATCIVAWVSQCLCILITKLKATNLHRCETGSINVVLRISLGVVRKTAYCPRALILTMTKI